ncbi:hypothetical protein DNHGIG_29510 [Collibacillus ludicampi]|jgi:hypothetical protein|uniref:Uncharacterized protein n=1 Tax=Collibacillus ludicampi TaxID=2771369 RepID=A0AAV4LHV5_9BACL|nr:hypothetical protein [Collibacillus ludicampi]GIM47402.1 hypothetical protein DNHGIG_29510 [Collibacillus ludicampi]
MPVITWLLVLEVAYFFLLLSVGYIVGRMMKKRMNKRTDDAPSARDEKIYGLLSVLFILVSLFYMIFGYIPGWIGRNIIFFGGYYWGMTRRLHR